MSVLANRWRIRAEFARVRASSLEFARVRGERQFAGYTALNFENLIAKLLWLMAIKVSAYQLQLSET